MTKVFYPFTPIPFILRMALALISLILLIPIFTEHDFSFWSLVLVLLILILNGSFLSSLFWKIKIADDLISINRWPFKKQLRLSEIVSISISGKYICPFESIRIDFKPRKKPLIRTVLILTLPSKGGCDFGSTIEVCTELQQILKDAKIKKQSTR